MGIFDFLTQGTAPPTGTSTTASVNQLPPWYEDYQRNLLAAGISAGNEDFQLYPNQRIADLTPKQREAITGGQNYSQDLAPLSQLAAEATTRGAAPFDPNQLKTFMNPYSEQVADIIGRRGEERYLDKFIDPVMDTFTSAGQFGSSRNMDFSRKAMEDASREITDAQTQALSTGYGQGLQGYEQFQNLAQQGGKSAADMSRGALDVLSAVGGQEQGQNQKSLDQLYKDFLEQRDYPWTQIDRLKALGSGISVPNASSVSSTTAPTTSQGGASPLETLSGILATIMATQQKT